MKILGKKIGNTTIYMILILLCLAFITFLLVRPINLMGREDKNEMGKVELFVKGINRPQGMALDKDGRLFVQSAYDGRISLINKDGKALDYTYVKDYYGYGIQLDEAGNFLVAAKQQVVVLDSSGKITRAINGFNNIYDVEKGPDNTIFVSDSFDNIIYSISPDNKVSVFANIEGQRSKSIPNAAGISFDKDYKNLYIVNMYRGELLKATLDENKQVKDIQVWGSNMQRPNYIDVDDSGNAYITCIGDNTVVRIDQNSIKEIYDSKGKLANPSGISVRSNGKDSMVYVASRDTNSIYKINIGIDDKKKK